ncbi:MAG: hypothetical protein HQ553_12095 [Chloroflexi bacterium]|nr:hypothetical protein [Chloroflexota bacterium]
MSRASSKTGTVILATLLLALLVLVACGGGSDETTEPVSTLTPMPTDSPADSETPVSTKTLTPEPTHTPDAMVTPIDTPVPTSSPTPTTTPTPSEETTPTSTDTPEPEAELQMCGFNGYVAIDDASVPDGTVISAWIDGELVGSAATTGSAYEMTVSGEYTGKVVTFNIGSYKATQTSIWESGADIVVGLSVRLGPPVCGFYGTVTHPGGNVPDDTSVSALVDGTVVGSTTVTGSWYNLLLTGEYSGKTIHFKVGADQVMETSIWERGGNNNVDLTVTVP